MALSCNPADIVKAAACFKCIPPNSAPLVKAYLLCQTAKIADPTSPCNTPSAPTALQVLNTSNTTIKVGWKQTKNTGSFITGYKVFWGTTSGGPYTSNSGVIPTLPRNYTITGLTPGTTYFAVVVALSAVPGCQSANSNQVSGNTSGQVPNGLLNSLVHYYQLQEAAAPFVDSGSSPLALGWSNFGADFSQVAGHVQAFAAHYNGVGALNGITSIIAAPINFSGDGSNNTSMTYAVWFNLSNAQLQAFPPVFALWPNVAGTQIILFRRDNPNQVGLYAQTAGGAGTVQITPLAANDNAWHLFVGGHDHPNGTLWASIDNGAKQTTPMATLNSVSNSPFVLFDWTAGNNEIVGSISDMGVWNGRVLSTTDIAALWNGGAGLPFNQFTT